MRASPRHRSSRTVLALGATVLFLVLVACGALNTAPSPGPTVDTSLGATVAAQGTAVARNGTIVAALATRVAALENAQSPSLPAPQSDGAPTGSPDGTPSGEPDGTPSGEVEGTVEIEGGRCCVGSTAGDIIDVEVAFSATSSAGEVTEMRVATAGIKFDAEAMADVPWGPFAPSRSYPVPVALNWTGFWVSAQFRDAAGNVSPVVYDDISVEGSPAGP